MKSAGVMVLAAVAAMTLSACATTGTTDTQEQWHATGGNSAESTRSAPNAIVVKADTKENFEAVVAAIHKQMAPGGRWQFVNPAERATIDGNFADMQTLYDKYGSVDAMDANSKLRLANDQSSVNAILTKKDGDRVICQSVLPVGSHLPVKMCKTYAQMQAEQQSTQRQLNDAAMRNDYQKIGGH